jgi:hypothetical protein
MSEKTYGTNASSKAMVENHQKILVVGLQIRR